MSKVVIITGASGNLGKVAVQKFAKAGFTVLGVASPAHASDLTLQGATEIFEINLTNEDQVKQWIHEVIEKYGQIDAALLLAGGYAPGNISDTGGEVIKKMISINFETAFFTAQAIFQQMLAQEKGGKIIMVGSRGALKASEGKNSLAYALSKSMIFQLAEYFNAEATGKQVFTHVVVPSTIDTPTNREAMPKADFSKWVTPEEISDAMLFLTQSPSLREAVLKIYGNA